jgi:ZIP family zinc transporter
MHERQPTSHAAAVGGPPIRWSALVVGAGIVAFAAALYSGALNDYGPRDERLRLALQGGLLAALGTTLGTLPIVFAQSFSDRVSDTALGFGAGVMLAACAFSLILPGLDAASELGYGKWGSGTVVGGGLILGALILLVINRAVPHEHFVKGAEGPGARALKRVWLFVFAILLHNFPEGLAIGVAAAGSDAVGAQALATGIAIQDVPEGMVVALALHGAGYGRRHAAALGALTGLVEPVAAVLGVLVIQVSENLLPWGLASAAGAMLFVISHEIIPESHRKGHESWATSGLIVGFALMMILDTALG